MFLVRLSFFIGGLLSVVIRDTKRRRRFRGKFNLFVLRPYISRFMKRKYGVKIKTLRFVRQQSLNRVVGIVNDKYYVKIFRNIPLRHIQDFAELMKYIEKRLPVKIPHIVVDDKISMYAYKNIGGFVIKDLDNEFVKKHKTKVLNQVKKFIRQLQTIDVKDDLGNNRYLSDMYAQDPTLVQCGDKRVLAHRDANFGSFLFDKNLNLVGVIDWDTVAITDDLDKDLNMFMGYWNNTKSWK